MQTLFTLYFMVVLVSFFSGVLALLLTAQCYPLINISNQLERKSLFHKLNNLSIQRTIKNFYKWPTLTITSPPPASRPPAAPNVCAFQKIDSQPQRIVITWQYYDSSGSGIYAQLFDTCQGTLKNVTDIFLVNKEILFDQTNPKVACLNNQTFIIVYESQVSVNLGPQYSSVVRLSKILGQFFDWNGKKIRDEISISGEVGAFQETAVSIISLNTSKPILNEKFVVTYIKNTVSASMVLGQNQVMAKIFSHHKIIGPFQVNTFDTHFNNAGIKIVPQISSLTNGNFIILWASVPTLTNVVSTSNMINLNGQLFNTLGQIKGPEFQVNQNLFSGLGFTVQGTQNGGFLISYVAWLPNEAIFLTNIIVQRFSEDATRLGSEILFMKTKSEFQTSPLINILPHDRFIVSINSKGLLSSTFSIKSIEFERDGKAMFAPTMVNDVTMIDQISPDNIILADGSIFFVWNNGTSSIIGRFVQYTR